jgi:hypothetical protein
MKTTTLWFWPTKNLRSFEILGFLYGRVAEDSSLLGPVAVSFGISLKKTTLRHSTEQPNFQNVRAPSTLPFIGRSSH